MTIDAGVLGTLREAPEGTEQFGSVEVTRWGDKVWLTIRSEQSVGKAIELTLDDAREVAALLTRSASSVARKIRDEPQA